MRKLEVELNWATVKRGVVHHDDRTGERGEGYRLGLVDLPDQLIFRQSEPESH